MRLKLIILSAITGAGLVWFSPFLAGDPNPQLYPPIKHADGTTEYRLINAGEDRIKGTSDDQHWVLRMPAGLWVKSMDEGRTEEQKRENPDYPYNLNFAMIIGLPDFDIVEDPFEGSLKDVLDVSVDAPIFRFGSGGFDGPPDGSFSRRHDLLANYNCRKDKEMGPGVFWLRQPSESEVREMAEIHGSDPLRGLSQYFTPPECYLSSARQAFAVYDQSDLPIGYGDCRLQPGSRDVLSDDDYCAFWFWLPVERKIQFQLRGKYVPQLQSIYEHVAGLLLEATDYNKSLNIVEMGTNR
jgi:hypothetical protein